MNRSQILAIGFVSLGLSIEQIAAKDLCPAPVVSAMEKAYPRTKISSCKQENEDGKIQYEVKLDIANQTRH